MYSRVVVPLDGSDLAEVVLPHVQEIAKGCSIPQIFLVSVTERLTGRVSRQAAPAEMPALEGSPPIRPMHIGSTFSAYIYANDPTAMRTGPVGMGKMARTALTYLQGVASRLEKTGIKADLAVLVGNPAEEILRFAKEEKADLIVVASRGKSGFNRWDMGNVAEKVIRAAEVPVVVVKPKPGFKETKSRRRGKPN